MLPAKLALATAMLVAAPTVYLFAGVGEPARAISDPAGLVFPASGAGGLSASALAEAAPKPSRPGTAQAAEAPSRVVKVLVDSPFALPAGTVAIPAYELAKPGPVPTPGSTVGYASPELRRVATAERAGKRDRRSASSKQQAAERALASSGDEVAPVLEPQPRRRAAPPVRYADRITPVNPFTALFR